MAINWNKISNTGIPGKTGINWGKISKALPKAPTSPTIEKVKYPSFSLDLKPNTGVAGSTPVSAWREADKKREEREKAEKAKALKGKATKEFEEYLGPAENKLAQTGDKVLNSIALQQGITIQKIQEESLKVHPLARIMADAALPTVAKIPGEIASSLKSSKAPKLQKLDEMEIKRKADAAGDPVLHLNDTNEYIKLEKIDDPTKAKIYDEINNAPFSQDGKVHISQRKSVEGKATELDINQAAKKYKHVREALDNYGIKYNDNIDTDFITFMNENSKKKLPAQKRAKIAREVKQGFDVPEDTKWEWLKRQLQDKMNRLETVVKATGNKSDDLDAYLKETLYAGRAAEKIDQFNFQMIKGPVKGASFIERMKNDNIPLDEMGAFLQAKHAKERNAHIATINKDMPDGGSGMTTRMADDILSEFRKSGKYDLFNKYADEFYETVTKKALQIREEAGLISKETRELLENTYKNYVPLKVNTETSGRTLSKGFSANSGIKRARGSAKERVNPFVQSILDYEDAVIQAEKNRVGQTFLKLVEANPNDKLWKVESLKYSPRYDKTGEIVRMDPRFKPADNVLSVMVDGKTKLITIHDKELAAAMKNIGVEKAIPLFQNFNSYIRAVATFYNPEFVISNFQRDIQTAMTHLAGEQSAKIARDTLKDVPKAMKGIWKNVRGQESEWSNYYREMKEAGGRVGWFDVKSIDQKISEVEKKINQYNSNKTKDKFANFLDTAGKTISDMNEVVESGVRLSAFKNARQAGMSVERAAELAKNLTVNFNKKGNLGVFLNSLYLFSNAGIQGTARILTSLTKSKTTRKIAVGIAASAFSVNQVNRSINEEEFDRIDPFIKDHYWIFMFPNGNYGKIKLPYGYNIFKVAGDLSEQLVMGKIGIAEASKRFILAVNDAFNPLSTGSLGQMIAPTAVEPFVQHAENKNFFGGQIKPDQPQFGPKQRESSLYFGSVRETSKEITEWLNDVTGGNDVEAGAIDISPEIIDHYVDFFTSGTGKFIANTVDTGVSLKNGEMPEIENMPFVRSLIGTPSEDYEKYQMYEMLDESARKHYSDDEIADFMETVKKAYKADQITYDQAEKNIRTFFNSQEKVQGGRIKEGAKKLKSRDDKEEFIKNLGTFEKKLLLDSLK